MKKVTLLSLVVAMLAGSFAVVGTAGAQAPPPYPVPGGCPNDVSLGAGNDTFTGTPVKDCVKLGVGNDTANVAGDPGSVDVVNCGDGTDSVTADADDKIRRNCENVTRR